MRTCGYCERSIVWKNAQARYCSDKCRNYARRLKLRTPIPTPMLNRDRWVRYSPTKRPLTVKGHAASSTDPRTWASHEEATASRAGIGIGYVLGDGIGCIDLDHCLIDGTPTAAALAFIVDYPGNYIEVSPSGDGLHIWGTAPEADGTKRNENGLSIERYSTGRYITVTGNVFQHGDLLPL